MENKSMRRLEVISVISKLNRSAREKGEFQTSNGKSHFIPHLYFSALHAFNWAQGNLIPIVSNG